MDRFKCEKCEDSFQSAPAVLVCCHSRITSIAHNSTLGISAEELRIQVITTLHVVIDFPNFKILSSQVCECVWRWWWVVQGVEQGRELLKLQLLCAGVY